MRAARAGPTFMELLTGLFHQLSAAVIWTLGISFFLLHGLPKAVSEGPRSSIPFSRD
jgi:hypothetical protein